MQEFLNSDFLGNTVISYCWFVGILLSAILFKKVISKLLSRLLFKAVRYYASGVGVERFVGLLSKPFGLFVLLVSFYLAFDRLEFPQHWHLVPRETFGVRMLIFRAFQVAIVLSITWILLRIVDFMSLVLSYKASIAEAKSDDQLVPFIKEAVKIVLSVFSIFFILGAIFHLNITSLIAGLGIGGLAIALAAKETLENLLGSVTIFFDKPFHMGDLVKVAGITGNIEQIGFRSTRIRTLDKTFVTVPNKRMVDAELENFTLRTHRRASFIVSLTYSTTAEQVKNIISDIKQALLSQPLTDKNEITVKFTNIGTNALEILVEYLVPQIDMDKFLQIKEQINFSIMEIVTRQGSALAFPSTTVYLQQRV